MINFSHYEKVVREGLRHVKSVFVYEGTCVKYVWARVKFPRTNAKNYPLCEICPNQAGFRLTK